MVEAIEPVGAVLGALEVLAVARTIMSYDPERIEKVAMLQEDVELSRMFPGRDDAIVLRKAISEVLAEVQC